MHPTMTESRPRAYPPETVEKAHQMLLEKRPLSYASAQLGVSASTLMTWSKNGNWGRWRGPSRRYYSDEERAEVHDMWDRGMNLGQIERATGVSPKTVRIWALRDGWKKTDRRRQPCLEPASTSASDTWPSGQYHTEAMKERVRDMTVNGATRAQIHDATGVREATITEWQSKYGWNKSPGRGSPKSCQTCKHRSECLARAGRGYPLACEVDILVDGQPESKLWSHNGGPAAIDAAYH